MTILVTGGAGFIGSNFVLDWLAQSDEPVVTLATAHPAKFADAVEHATGVRAELPEHLADLLTRPERFTSVPNDLVAVQRFVASVSATR